MTEIDAIKKVIPVLRRIQQDINTISDLIDNASKNPDDFDENEAVKFIEKIGEDWEDELNDARTLLELTGKMNEPTKITET